MGLFDLTDIALERGMQGASLRQQLLSNNIANVNTPGFKRTDVDFSSQLATAMQSGSTSDVESLTFQPQTDSATSLRADSASMCTLRPTPLPAACCPGGAPSTIACAFVPL